MYLGVKVGTDAEMRPRQLITSTAFAVKAAYTDDANMLDGFDSTSFLNTDGGLGDLDHGNLLVQGVGSFDANGEEGILYLGDTNNYIKSVHGSGVRIGAFDANDALAIEQGTGDVGIGVPSPESKLDVAGLITSRGIGLDCGLRLFNPIGGRDYRLLEKDDGRLTITDETASQERLIMDSSGNVGIGTNPSAKLDVSGGITASGALRIGNDTVLNVNGGKVGIGKSNPDAKLDVLSTTGYAIYAESPDEDAIKGVSHGSSKAGIMGINDQDLGRGVWGENISSDNHGFLGGPYIGVYGVTRGYGSSSDPVNAGVYGIASNEGYIDQTGDHAINYGGYFVANGKSGTGVYAKGGVSGDAAFFDGDLQVYGHSYFFEPMNIQSSLTTEDLEVTGTLTKGAGSFKIDHPIDPENKYLSHSFVESPDMMNVYNGNIVLDEDGEAWVELPEWFEALNKDFRYQLTCIGGFAPVYVAKEISDLRFKIEGGSPGLKVSWQVTGIRQDPYAEAHRIPVEEDKVGDEQGTYLHPELYGQPAEKSVSLSQDSKIRRKMEKDKSVHFEDTPTKMGG